MTIPPGLLRQALGAAATAALPLVAVVPATAGAPGQDHDPGPDRPSAGTAVLPGVLVLAGVALLVAGVRWRQPLADLRRRWYTRS